MLTIKLNLGSGNDYREGYLNVDKYADTADINYDLEQLPWPWETNSVTEVILRHVLEHLGQQTELFLNLIKELHRVCAPNALVIIDVPHPLHPDYLGDPTHCRPITAEALWLFNRAYADWLIAVKAIGTPLATYLNVDFVMEENTEFRDSGGRLQASRFTLRVKKPIKLALMSNGLGDVIMGLGACHALHDSGYRVSVTVMERYHDIVKVCPHVYSFSESDRAGEIWTCAWNNLQARHQVDEIVSMCGLNPDLVDDNSKSVVLNIDSAISSAIYAMFLPTNKIVIATACSSKNRKWPKEKWQELVNKFRAYGIEVISSGMNTGFWHDEYGSDTLEGVTEAFNLPLLYSIELYKQCKLVISSDSAPIHMAGIGEAGILGLFSVMAPEFRLPFRHGEFGWKAFGITTSCKYSPCYPNMVKDYGFVWSDKANSLMSSGISMADVTDQWCDNPEDHMGCMKHITVDEVYNKAIEMYNREVI